MIKRKHASSKAKKRTLGFLALLLVVVICVGTGLAYLTSTSEATNKFTLGDIDTPIDEPNWKNPVKKLIAINGDNGGKLDRNGDAVVEGDVLTYSITVTNADTDYHDMVITDTIEPGLSYLPDPVSSNGDYDYAYNKITWEFFDVEPLSEITVYFKAVVTDKALSNKYVENSAWASVGNNPAKESNKVVNPLTTDALDNKKSVSDTSEAGKNGSAVTVGDLITYEILVYNNSDRPGTVTVTDTLDSQVEYVNDDSGGKHSNGVVTWTFNDMPAHSSMIITLIVEVKSIEELGNPSPIDNKAEITDPDGPGRDTNIVTIPVQDPDSPKKPEKTYSTNTPAGAGGLNVNIGDDISYDIRYYNHENSSVDITIVDTIEAGLTVNEMSILNGGIYDPIEHTITWKIPNVPANERGFVSFSATVNEDAVLKVSNMATVQIGNNAPINTNKLVNDTQTTQKPGETEIKDPTVEASNGDSFLRFKVEFQDKNGDLLTNNDQIDKIIDTLYYDTSYVYQGTVSDTSTLTSNIVAGTSYTKQQLDDLVLSRLVYREYNELLFKYDDTRDDNYAVRYYNYIANNGLFTEGNVATLFTNTVLPSDWTSDDFEILGGQYIVKVTVEACQADGFSQDQAYDELDHATQPKP